MAEASAWLLALDTELQAAVGELQMVHLLQSPTLFEVIDAPVYCRQVVLWQQAVVPVFDLAAWLRASDHLSAPVMLGIFAYQATDSVAYGALPLLRVPTRRRVSDDQACALPEEPPGWALIAMSCFKDGDNEIPILDLYRLFSGALLHEEIKPLA